MNREMMAALLEARTHGIDWVSEPRLLAVVKLIEWDYERCEWAWTDAGHDALKRLDAELKGVPVDTALLMGGVLDRRIRTLVYGVVVHGCVVDGVQWATDGHALVRVDRVRTSYGETLSRRYVRDALASIDPTATPATIEKVVLVPRVRDYIRGNTRGHYGPIYVAEIRGRRFQFGVVRALLRHYAGSVLVPGAKRHRVGVVAGGSVVAVVPALEGDDR